MPDPVLCFVTNRDQTGGRPLDVVTEAAVDGGVNMVQLRERDLAGGHLLNWAFRLRQITKGRALLIVNDRVDIALLSGADGVQLGEEGIKMADVRRIAGNSLLLGRSVHSVDSAKIAAWDGADFLIVGTIFPTGSHPGGVTVGPELISEIRGVTDVPILAIGGIDDTNIQQVMTAGANGAAIITAISRRPDPQLAARNLMSNMSKRQDS
ncbi:MAG: thiamine phosphate synthase [Chloroflexi bacterium]|nr:thiamine phosphate synthase [Chloroflexota bacterium]